MHNPHAKHCFGYCSDYAFGYLNNCSRALHCAVLRAKGFAVVEKRSVK